MTIKKDLTLTHGAVTLKTLTPEMLPAMSAIAHNPLIWKYTTAKITSSADFAKQWLNKAIDQLNAGKRWPFAIEYQGKIAGSSSYYEMDAQHRRLTMGYTWYHPDYWGTALNPTVKLLLLDYAFETLNCVRVDFHVDHANERSRKALIKIGAQQEGVLRNHMIRPNGTHRHTVVFSIIDTDWPAVKQALLTKITEKS